MKKIASAYDIPCPLQDSKIVVSDAELDLNDQMPTLNRYLVQLGGGASRSIFGLYTPDNHYDSEEVPQQVALL